MKTPEKVAQEITLRAKQNGNAIALLRDITAAISAERARADALATALQSIAQIPLGPDRGSAQSQIDCAEQIARAALAAYEAGYDPR